MGGPEIGSVGILPENRETCSGSGEYPCRSKRPSYQEPQTRFLREGEDNRCWHNHMEFGLSGKYSAPEDLEWGELFQDEEVQ